MSDYEYFIPTTVEKSELCNNDSNGVVIFSNNLYNFTI